MTLHQLEILLSVAKHLSFSKAAKEHHISQPAVSLHIKLLETEYNVKLFKKNGKDVELSGTGYKFAYSAKEILSLVENLKNDMRGPSTTEKVLSLHIGGSESHSHFLPPVIAAFKKTHPDLRIILQSEDSGILEQKVLNLEIEIALVTNPSYYGSLNYEPYRNENVLAFVSPRHPLAKKKGVSLSNLVKESLVIRRGKVGPSMTEKYIKEVRLRGYELSATVLCDSAEAVKTIVKSGVGIGILYWNIIASDIRQGNLKSIKIPGLSRTINTFIIYHKEVTLSPIAKTFQSFLRNLDAKTIRGRGTVRVLPFLKHAGRGSQSQ